jgi:ABC-type cobalamin/Fe3+-siderophores transport system ATPase subunit
MNVIDLDRASIRVGDRTVLSEITISVGAGEFIGVLGPNGSGKTTDANAAWLNQAEQRYCSRIWPRSATR